MAWCTAKCAFRTVRPGSEHPSEALGEYRYFPIKADDSAAAMDLAISFARGEEHEYENLDGKTARWEFERVVAVKDLFDEAIAHGTEVYYEFYSPGENEK